MALTTLLGFGFLVGQYEVWQVLQADGVIFKGNPSGSFLYVLTGLHAFHLVTGVAFLLIMLIQTFRFKVHSREMTYMDMCNTYWHFLDGLWIYLFIFLTIYHQ
jgi:cytochrome c oxidase subunit III